MIEILEDFITKKAQSLYGFSEELLEITNSTVLRYIDDNTVAIVMAPDAQELFKSIEEN